MSNATVDFKKPILMMGNKVTRQVMECPDRKLLDRAVRAQPRVWCNLSRTHVAQAVSAMLWQMVREHALRVLEEELKAAGTQLVEESNDGNE